MPKNWTLEHSIGIWRLLKISEVIPGQRERGWRRSFELAQLAQEQSSELILRSLQVVARSTEGIEPLTGVEIRAIRSVRWKTRCYPALSWNKVFFEDQLIQLRNELDIERERNKQLIGGIAVIEANAGSLGIDREELYRAVLKPLRNMSRALEQEQCA